MQLESNPDILSWLTRLPRSEPCRPFQPVSLLRMYKHLPFALNPTIFSLTSGPLYFLTSSDISKRLPVLYYCGFKSVTFSVTPKGFKQAFLPIQFMLLNFNLSTSLYEIVLSSSLECELQKSRSTVLSSSLLNPKSLEEHRLKEYLVNEWTKDRWI